MVLFVIWTMSWWLQKEMLKITHNALVEVVMKRLDTEGCEFSVNLLTWLGYEINEQRYSPKFSRNEAIQSLKPPKTLKQLRSFMGTLNHINGFIPDLHTHKVHLRQSPKIL